MELRCVMCQKDARVVCAGYSLCLVHFQEFDEEMITAGREAQEEMGEWEENLKRDQEEFEKGLRQS